MNPLSDCDRRFLSSAENCKKRFRRKGSKQPNKPAYCRTVYIKVKRLCGAFLCGYRVFVARLVLAGVVLPFIDDLRSRI
jgi:hypothetical protein